MRLTGWSIAVALCMAGAAAPTWAAESGDGGNRGMLVNRAPSGGDQRAAQAPDSAQRGLVVTRDRPGEPVLLSGRQREDNPGSGGQNPAPVTSEATPVSTDTSPSPEEEAAAPPPIADAEEAETPPLAPWDAQLPPAPEAYDDIEALWEALEIEPTPGAVNAYRDEIQQLLDEERIELDVFYRALEEDPDFERVPMTLGEAIRAALANNEDILVASYEPGKFEADLLAAHGEFDPMANAGASYTRTQETAPSDVAAFGGIDVLESHTSQANVGVGGLLHWGTAYDITFNMTRDQSTFTRMQEEWGGRLALTLQQPLLRGRGQDVNLTRIRAAQHARQMAGEQLHMAVMSTITEVIKAYWDVVGAQETVRVQEESLANAERLLEINRRRLEIGAAASIDVLQAEAGVAARQGDLISARSQLRNTQDRLNQMLNVRDDGYLARAGILPVEELQVHDPELDERTSVQRALDNRPEVRTAELEIANAQLEERRARNDLRPELGVTGMVSTGGRDADASGMFSGLRDRQDDSYRIGVDGAVPIGNRAARGNHQRARISMRQAEQDLAQTEHEVMLNVRLAIRGVETARILVESSRQARILQEANVRAEERRLELGATTSYQVLQVQEDLTGAQVQEVQAMIDFEKAMADLRLAEGLILQAHDVYWETPEAEEPESFLDSVVPWPLFE